MKERIEESIAALQARGASVTFQRRAVISLMHTKPGHWTADEVLGALRPRYGSLSRATVYKTLELLCVAGELDAFRLHGDVTRYDTMTRPHHHFLCRTCAKLVDIDVRCPIEASCKVEDHRVEHLQAFFVGTCAGCLARLPGAAST